MPRSIDEPLAVSGQREAAGEPPPATVTAPPCRSIAYDERSMSSVLVPSSPGSTSWHAAVVDVVVTDSAAGAARNDPATPAGVAFVVRANLPRRACSSPLSASEPTTTSASLPLLRPPHPRRPLSHASSRARERRGRAGCSAVVAGAVAGSGGPGTGAGRVERARLDVVADAVREPTGVPRRPARAAAGATVARGDCAIGRPNAGRRQRSASRSRGRSSLHCAVGSPNRRAFQNR